ncbi:MAG: hypothetical protein AAF423_06510 [Pseudomonadota bacterium]
MNNLEWNQHCAQSAVLPVCERILLEGCRSLFKDKPWSGECLQERTRRIFDEFVGKKASHDLSEHLLVHLECLNHGRVYPIRTYPTGCEFICRDEAVFLGLIAGIQNGNATTVALCLDYLCCPSCVQQSRQTAENLVACLSRCKKYLLPVPANVIRDILTRGITTPSLH